MPAITNMRYLARNGKLSAEEDVQHVMRVPIRADTLFRIVLKNRETLIAEFANDFGVPLHVETIQHYVDIMKKANNDNNNNNTAENNVEDASIKGSTIHTSATAEIQVFDDEQSASELVFGIAVNQ